MAAEVKEEKKKGDKETKSSGNHLGSNLAKIRLKEQRKQMILKAINTAIGQAALILCMTMIECSVT